MKIRYFKKDGEFMVSQTIERISYYDLEGTLDKVISFLQKMKTSSLKEMQLIDDYNDIPKNEKLSMLSAEYRKLRTKTVKFDYSKLEIGSGYDGENELQLIGYRKMTDEEKEVFEKEEQTRNVEQLERKLQEYERLKRELEC